MPCVQVLQVTEEMYDVVQPTLRRLVLSCTMDVDTNPMSREGAPNRLMQKLLRENDAIHLVMAIIALPFQKVPELRVSGTTYTHQGKARAGIGRISMLAID